MANYSGENLSRSGERGEREERLSEDGAAGVWGSSGFFSLLVAGIRFLFLSSFLRI